MEDSSETYVNLKRIVCMNLELTQDCTLQHIENEIKRLKLFRDTIVDEVKRSIHISVDMQ